MEQKAVCYGLCVPSYLCKIEQGAVHPNPDLLSALYQRLGIVYTQEESLLHPLEQMLQDYFTKLEYGLDIQETYETLQAQADTLRHSPLALHWLLVQGYQGEAVLPLLEQLQTAMTDRQLALYKLLRCRADPMAPDALALCQEACHVLNCSAAMMELTSLYLLHGDYAAIHRMESRLVAAAVEEGNVYCLADYCFMNATAYACLNQEAMTITYYERCIRLLQNTGWREILGDVHYNLGAMYISLRKYALCLDHLDQAEQNSGTLSALGAQAGHRPHPRRPPGRGPGRLDTNGTAVARAGDHRGRPAQISRGLYGVSGGLPGRSLLPGAAGAAHPGC